MSTHGVSTETSRLINEISRMAERVGARFVPDPKKIREFDAAHGSRPSEKTP